jgi:dolichol-phosphate mannosyltransferase
VAHRPEISVVVPLHNEAQVVRHLVRALIKVLRTLQTSWEIVLVDDGSSDDTARQVRDLAAREPGIVPVELSRNFGKESALAAGLEAAVGEAVIVMNGDLQHPPSLIPEMVRRWRYGAEVINAVRSDRGRETLSYRLTAKLLHLLTGEAMGRRIESQTDFKLLDRQVVDQLRGFREQQRFFRGLVAWVGFRVDEVPFNAHERSGRSSSFGGLQLARHAVRNLLAFSSGPLQAIAWLGFIAMAFAGFAAQTIYSWTSGQAIDGFTTATLVTLVLGGINLACLGVVAAYQSVMYHELKGRPAFIVRRSRSARSGRVIRMDRDARTRSR